MTMASEQVAAAAQPGDGSDAAEDTPARTDEADAAAASSSAAARAAEPGDSTPAKRQPEGEPEKEPPAVRSRPSTSQSTGNAAQADKGEAAEEEVAVEKPRVQVYGSTVSGNRTYKKQAKELFTMLEACEVDFEFICIAADEGAKRYIRRKALGNMTIPQIYVDGELRGFFDDAFKANECDELYEWLGLDEDPVE
ncbi:hypothetical protein H4R18_003464 [Coemansia javaensis]|uniref:Glutaredoxin domain-containing protein n=1 Tax=Coemansia javaensis TaxID=2761396 RepID=A0A9W8HAC3_9FUNG|nr:hypothetical protein H4R18_003464 [Coemansia javaensis]